MSPLFKEETKAKSKLRMGSHLVKTGLGTRKVSVQGWEHACVQWRTPWANSCSYFLVQLEDACTVRALFVQQVGANVDTGT